MPNYEDSPEEAEAEFRAANAEVEPIDNDLDSARASLERFEVRGNAKVAAIFEGEISDLEQDFDEAMDELGRLTEKWEL